MMVDTDTLGSPCQITGEVSQPLCIAAVQAYAQIILFPGIRILTDIIKAFQIMKLYWRLFQIYLNLLIRILAGQIIPDCKAGAYTVPIRSYMAQDRNTLRIPGELQQFVH